MTVLMGENLKNEKTFHEPVIFSTFHDSQWTLWKAVKKRLTKNMTLLFGRRKKKRTDRRLWRFVSWCMKLKTSQNEQRTQMELNRIWILCSLLLLVDCCAQILFRDATCISSKLNSTRKCKSYYRTGKSS